MAEALPFSDNSYDCVVSQFGLMYFENQTGAIREMMRVIKPGGSLAVAVWDGLANNPGLAAEEILWQQLFGGEVEETPYSLGDKGVLENLFKAADVTGIQITTAFGGKADVITGKADIRWPYVSCQVALGFQIRLSQSRWHPCR